MIFFSCLDARFSGLMTFFSSLDRRKEGKRRSRRQGRRPIWGLSTIIDVPGKTSPPSVEGLSFFCFFSFLKERKEGLIRKSSKASWSSFLLLIQDFLAPWSSFLALMQEKKAKENQGVRDAGQIEDFRLLSMYPEKTSPPSVEDLSSFCFFSFLKERKEGPIGKPSKASHMSENKRSPVGWTGGLSGLP